MKKRGCISGKCSQKITKVEEEVLHLLSDEFMTPKQIAIRRGISHQAVYKTIRNLKKKGAINPINKRVEQKQSTLQPSIRLHGQEFNIKILYKAERYRKIQKKCNKILLDGNTIRLYNNSIEVYSGHSFYGDDAQKATAESIKYWNRLFTRIEHDLQIIIVKNRAQNIKLVNHHYAEINNELAEESERKGYKIRIYATEDAKVWFTIDNSFNLHEAETLHPQTAKHDMQDKVKPFFNDIRDNPLMVLSDIRRIQQDAIKIQSDQAMLSKETATELATVVKIIALGMKKPEPPEPPKQKEKEERSVYFG